MEDEVSKRLASIEKRLDALERLLVDGSLKIESTSVGEPPISARNLLSVPDTLRRTLMALQNLGEATSQQVAQKTGRTRSMETVYLNQLTMLNYVTRRRRGRKVYFKIARYY